MDRADALKTLDETREQIEKIDEKIIKLVKKRTMLARNIANAKFLLGVKIEDRKREKYVLQKTEKIAIREKIDRDSIKKIMKILTNLNKKEQEEIFRRKSNGKH